MQITFVTYEKPVIIEIPLETCCRIMTGSPDNPGGTIDPFVFEEEEQ